MIEAKAAVQPDTSARDISLGITLALGAFATFYLISAVQALLTLAFGYAVARGVPVSMAQGVLPALALVALATKALALHWVVRRGPARLASAPVGLWPTTLAVLGGLSVFISMGINTFIPVVLARMLGPSGLATWSIASSITGAFSQLAHGALVVGFLIYAAQRWRMLATKARAG